MQIHLLGLSLKAAADSTGENPRASHAEVSERHHHCRSRMTVAVAALQLACQTIAKFPGP
jgi:hypothetical protein